MLSTYYFTAEVFGKGFLAVSLAGVFSPAFLSSLAFASASALSCSAFNSLIFSSGKAGFSG